MTIDREARTVLRTALVRYMSGAIRTFAFEDQYSPCGESRDESVQVIVRQVWCRHDELIDHPISVTQEGWESLRRTVAFLGTDLETAPPGCGSWPFRDEADWHLHEHLVNELGLPDYDPDVQGRPANPWWNRIPTSVGVLILVTSLMKASPGNREGGFGCRSGPAMYIAFFALIGGVVGIPLLANERAIGFLTVVPGALLGGLFYRFRSRNWPIDPAARARRLGYALIVTIVPPGLIVAVAGLRAQGLGMTLVGLVIGAALAAGILISGDRRPVHPA